jgi:site-specific DNA recombinase
VTRRGVLQAVPSPAAEPSAVLYLRVSTKEQAQRGGEAEGFSIPAQRQACLRKAESLGAQVVSEFIDAGESARSADRPELQRLLTYVAAESVDYVIVHKVDRLARNRYDDAVITAQLQAAGARLVSVTENIDQTPSGLLLHGIMSSIAEFYSRNLANEVIKGTQQKVSAGGTPHIAPIGYRNVREEVAGREARTVVVDEERAPLVRWAFEAYATGDYTLTQLADELRVRGLMHRPTAQRVARPVTFNKLHQILRNRYYLGLVSWRGVEYPGKHPALVDAATFEAVQAVLTAHRLAGERSQKHKHYLSGSLFCARCGSRLLFGISTGRQGDHYEYFFCSSRHSGRTGCDLPYLPVEQVEEAVAAQWHREVFPPELVAALREQLTMQLRAFNATAEQERRRLTDRVATIRRERFKWAEKAMEGVVPDDIARERQQLLADQLLAAESALSRLSLDQDSHEATLHAVLDLVRSCGRAYELSESKGRRNYNQAFFTGIFLDVEHDEPRPKVATVRRTPVLAALQEHRGPDGFTTAVDQEQQRRQDQSLDGVDYVSVSNNELLVELTGLEPMTFSVRRLRLAGNYACCGRLSVHCVHLDHRRGVTGVQMGHGRIDIPGVALAARSDAVR